jgi:hypothetical protein
MYPALSTIAQLSAWLLAGLTTWSTPTHADRIEGAATFMSQGRMEQVVANRHITLDGYVGAVALNRQGDLYRDVWIQHDGTISGPYLVVDCAQAGQDFEVREAQHRILEVGWDLAQAWHMRGPHDVTVWLVEPSTASPERSEWADPPGAR